MSIKDITKKILENAIMSNVTSGKYKSINEVRIKNPNLDTFCFNHKLDSISHSFSRHFTNKDYVDLLNDLENKIAFIENNGQLLETNIDGQVFLEKKDKDNQETLVGVDEVTNTNNPQNLFKSEKMYEKRVANFIEIADINPSEMNLNQEQIIIYNAIMHEPDSSKYEIYFDEKGNMTNIVRDNQSNYYTIEINDDNIEFVEHSTSNKGKQNTNQKVKTLTNGHNISDGFANILIFSFIIGSFFGIVFLAIYTKFIH